MDTTPESIRERFARLRHPELGERIAGTARVGVQLRRELVPDASLPVGSSKLGGLPDLPEGIAWPRGPKRDLDFLAQIDVAEARKWGALDLPADGLLMFFYDELEQPWGSAPDDHQHWRVLHVPRSGLARRAPSRPLIFKRRAPKVYPSARLLGCPRTTYNTAVLSYAEAEDEAITHAMEELQSELEANEGDEPAHMIGGNPDEVQGSVFEGAEDAVFGDRSGDDEADDPVEAAERVTAMAAQRGWSLLLQLDSDNELKWCWGDLGLLYFCVPRDEVRQGVFERLWVQLQCY